MKLLLLLFISSLFVNLIQSKTYINFTPVPFFVNSQGYCVNNNDDPQPGIGYSVLVGQCFTLDGLYSHIIQAADNGEYLVSMYNNVSKGVAYCEGPAYSQFPVFEDSGCKNPVIFNYNYMNYHGYNVNISITNYEIPFYNIPSNSFVNSYLSNNCDVQSTYLIEYYVGNPTVNLINGDEVSFICKNNEPYTVTCRSGDPSHCENQNEETTCAKFPQNYLKTVYCSN